MKRVTTHLALFLLALLVLAGCSTAANVEPGADAGAGEGASGEGASGEGAGTGEESEALVDSHEELRAALEAAGLEIEQDEVLLDSFFADTTARFLLVNEAMIQTFAFADAAAAAAGAETVNATGTIIGAATIDWVERPHFYRQGKLIVLYAGDDEAILSALQEALGEPFVVGESAFAPAEE